MCAASASRSITPRSNTTLNFARITQPWLRDAAKQYLRYCLAQHDTGSSFGYLQGIVTFSRFLAQRGRAHPARADRPRPPAGLFHLPGRAGSVFVK